jgi:hypothetical protein
MVDISSTSYRHMHSSWHYHLPPPLCGVINISYIYIYTILDPAHPHLHLHLLERVFNLIVLPDHNLPLLLRALMLDPHLPCDLARKLANKPRIPQFARDTQVLAAAHQGVGFAALGRRRDAVGVEVLLLAAGY